MLPFYRMPNPMATLAGRSMADANDVPARIPGEPSRALLRLLKSVKTNAPGVTADEVLASDLRLRRRLAGERGRLSSLVTGGLGDTAKLTFPSLIGI